MTRKHIRGNGNDDKLGVSHHAQNEDGEGRSVDHKDAPKQGEGCHGRRNERKNEDNNELLIIENVGLFSFSYNYRGLLSGHSRP